MQRVLRILHRLRNLLLSGTQKISLKGTRSDAKEPVPFENFQKIQNIWKGETWSGGM